MDTKDIAQQQIDVLPVKVGQMYVHFKNPDHQYEIIALAIQEDTLEPLVIYRNRAKGTTWSRTAKNFTEEIERDGKKQKRFELITKNGLTLAEEAAIIKADEEARKGKNVTRYMSPKEAIQHLDSI